MNDLVLTSTFASASAATVRVVLHLAGGETVDVDAFETPEQARACARDIMRDLVRPEPGAWPLFAGRYIRPDAILAIGVEPD